MSWIAQFGLPGIAVTRQKMAPFDFHELLVAAKLSRLATTATRQRPCLGLAHMIAQRGGDSGLSLSKTQAAARKYAVSSATWAAVEVCSRLISPSRRVSWKRQHGNAAEAAGDGTWQLRRPVGTVQYLGRYECRRLPLAAATPPGRILASCGEVALEGLERLENVILQLTLCTHYRDRLATPSQRQTPACWILERYTTQRRQAHLASGLARRKVRARAGTNILNRYLRQERRGAVRRDGSSSRCSPTSTVPERVAVSCTAERLVARCYSSVAGALDRGIIESRQAGSGRPDKGSCLRNRGQVNMSPDAEDGSPSPEPGTEQESGIMAEENATKEERASTEEKSPSKDGNNNNNGNQSSKSNSKDPSRPRRKKARRACFACQRAHLTCGDERPCLRCIKRGLQDQCHDGVRKKANGSRSTASRAEWLAGIATRRVLWSASESTS
ncbi:hypothetical protein KC339_g62 [Hortaea werneckii]|nr:hypothetical protein KC339_g62 [Hortaea werneckii]